MTQFKIEEPVEIEHLGPPDGGLRDRGTCPWSPPGRHPAGVQRRKRRRHHGGPRRPSSSSRCSASPGLTWGVVALTGDDKVAGTASKRPAATPPSTGPRPSTAPRRRPSCSTPSTKCGQLAVVGLGLGHQRGRPDPHQRPRRRPRRARPGLHRGRPRLPRGVTDQRRRRRPGHRDLPRHPDRLRRLPRRRGAADHRRRRRQRGRGRRARACPSRCRSATATRCAPATGSSPSATPPSATSPPRATARSPSPRGRVDLPGRRGRGHPARVDRQRRPSRARATPVVPRSTRRARSSGSTPASSPPARRRRRDHPGLGADRAGEPGRGRPRIARGRRPRLRVALPLRQPDRPRCAHRRGRPGRRLGPRGRGRASFAPGRAAPTPRQKTRAGSAPRARR